MPARRGSVNCICAAALLAGLAHCRTHTTPAQNRCAQLTPAARTADTHVRVLTGSALLAGGGLEPGDVPACNRNLLAARVFLQARQLILDIPTELRPQTVAIHLSHAPSAGLAPPWHIEFHRPSRSLLLGGGTDDPIDPSVFLHELAHVKMAGDRPERAPASRLMRAVEEGIADYFAAALGGSPRLGSASTEHTPTRDLRHPPRLMPGDWESIALEGLPEQPHRLGWVLAAELRRLASGPGPLLEDLLQCMAGLHLAEDLAPTAKAILAAWLSTCPARSRQSLQTALTRWLPPALRGP